MTTTTRSRGGILAGTARVGEATVEFWGTTHAGLVKRTNADAFRVVNLTGERVGEDAVATEDWLEGCLALVADGTGDGDIGAEGSALALETFVRSLLEADEFPRETSPETIRTRLGDATARANEEILFERRYSAAKASIGSTLVGAWLREGRLYALGAGEGRVLLARRGRAWALVGTLEEFLAETKHARLQRSPDGRITTRTVVRPMLGTERVFPYVEVEESLEPGDLVVLQSDGAYRHLERGETGTLLDERPLEAIGKQFQDLALSRGARDNLTTVLLRVRAS